MYNYLVNATKQRLITELKDLFSKHPIYKKLEIYNRFPYNERIQEGIIIRNSSASRQPLSADNFQATVISHAVLGKNKNTPGTSIEWVKEDVANIVKRVERVDVSSQFTSANDTISLYENLYKDDNDLTFANSPRDVEVYVNNNRVSVSGVDGQNQRIFLVSKPPINSIVEVSYYIRNLAPPGIYQVEIVGGNPEIHKYQFRVTSLLERDELLIEEASGDEETFNLPDNNIHKGSVILYENDCVYPKEDLIVDYVNRSVTLLTKPLINSCLKVSYRVVGLPLGPFELPYFNTINNTAIPGITMAFGRSVQIGDIQYVIISRKREIVAKEFSGKWDMTFSVDAYSKDSYQVEEIADLTTTHLQVYRKSDLDAEGIALVTVNFGGESEQVFDEGTGDLYYTGSVDFQFLTEWIMHQPLVYPTIEGFTLVSSVFTEREIPPYFPNRNKSFERIV